MDIEAMQSIVHHCSTYLRESIGDYAFFGRRGFYECLTEDISWSGGVTTYIYPDIIVREFRDRVRLLPRPCLRPFENQGIRE